MTASLNANDYWYQSSIVAYNIANIGVKCYIINLIIVC